MQSFAIEALDAVIRRGVSYADVRVVESRSRDIAVKNGRIGRISSSVSLGLGVRVLANGCWGFAATDDLDREGIQKAAALALEIAQSGSLAKKQDIELAPEEKYEEVWVSPIQIDPFSISVDRNLELLTAVERQLRRNPGVTMAETSMNFRRTQQVFASSIGSVIDQTRYV